MSLSVHSMNGHQAFTDAEKKILKGLFLEQSLAAKMSKSSWCDTVLHRIAFTVPRSSSEAASVSTSIASDPLECNTCQVYF